MEITVDRPSLFYEPGEKVTGQLILKDCKFTDLKGSLDLKAESFMDTVSMIRGKMGRPALDEKDKTYFMKKKILAKEPTGIGRQRPFEF